MKNDIGVYHSVVLLTVFRYAEYRFILVEKTKSAKNIWEPVIVKLLFKALLWLILHRNDKKYIYFIKYVLILLYIE